MSTTAPDTIVLVHGFWVTPRSWEQWIAHYESRGYRVIAPGTRIRGGGRVAQRRHLADRGADGAGDRRAPRVGRRRDRDAADHHGPFGRGAFTQILLDHGFGAAEVALNSLRRRIKVTPLSQIKSTFPSSKSPANRHKAIGLSEDGGATPSARSPRTSRAGSTSDTTSRYRGASCGAESSQASSPGHPGHVGRLPQRRPCPLLFVSGARITSCRRACGGRTRSTTRARARSQIKEYEGKAHLLPAQEGWQGDHRRRGAGLGGGAREGVGGEARRDEHRVVVHRTSAARPCCSRSRAGGC